MPRTRNRPRIGKSLLLLSTHTRFFGSVGERDKAGDGVTGADESTSRADLKGGGGPQKSPKKD